MFALMAAIALCHDDKVGIDGSDRLRLMSTGSLCHGLPETFGRDNDVQGMLMSPAM
jgi:hypothetical protein